MKPVLKIVAVLGALILWGLANQFGEILGESALDRFSEGKNKASLDAMLTKASGDMNKQLPIMLDSETRLDSTIGLNKTMRLNFTMVNYSAEEIDLDLFRSTRPNKVNSLCTADDMKLYLDNDILVSYAYFGKDGKQITVFRISPSECSY